MVGWLATWGVDERHGLRTAADVWGHAIHHRKTFRMMQQDNRSLVEGLRIAELAAQIGLPWFLTMVATNGRLLPDMLSMVRTRLDCQLHRHFFGDEAPTTQCVLLSRLSPHVPIFRWVMRCGCMPFGRCVDWP